MRFIGIYGVRGILYISKKATRKSKGITHCNVGLSNKTANQAKSLDFNPPLLKRFYIPFTHRNLFKLAREFILAALAV